MPKTHSEAVDALEPFVANATTHRMRRNNWFSLCLRASFAKTYEFNKAAHSEHSEQLAFFLVPTLRSACEDLVVLSFLRKLPPKDRQSLVLGLMQHDLLSNLRIQHEFFSVAREEQPVLQPPRSANRKALEVDLRAIWRRHGWPKLNRGKAPPVREIAERSHPVVLAHLYDYIYRLTSATVHFSPQALLRSGWGSRRKTKFSSVHLQPYYLSCCQVYGAYLLSLYFELFAKFLRPGSQVQNLVCDLREAVSLLARWPEMVTFEEMNQPVPDTGLLHFTVRFFRTEQIRHGFLVAAEKGAA